MGNEPDNQDKTLIIKVLTKAAGLAAFLHGRNK